MSFIMGFSHFQMGQVQESKPEVPKVVSFFFFFYKWQICPLASRLGI